MNEIIVDLFAGGGGASAGIRLALGRDPDVAINHDQWALAMHMANHPNTRHIRKDIWEVPPRWATGSRPVGLVWASPDCKHFSKAKGAALQRDIEVRSLAWVVEKWAREVTPRIIILENVEEFLTWGPLDKKKTAVQSQKGSTFRAFVRRLRRLGYVVEWDTLRACDYGAPTIRKRLFLIARHDGQPIVWPEPTHGPKLNTPYRTAAEIINWSLPCPSIFERKRPLVENTLRRIAEGIRRYVIEASEPFIVTCNHSGGFRGQGLHEPFCTVTASRDAHGLVIPHLQRQFGQGVGSSVRAPVSTITAGGLGKTALVAAFMAQHNTGVIGHDTKKPVSTITSRGTQQNLVTSNLVKFRGTCKHGQAITHPIPTITAGGTHVAEVRAFLMKYYSTGGQWQNLNNPVHTVKTHDTFSLVTVIVDNKPYVIADIGMRMLTPRELFRAQGFDDDYRIDDITVKEKRITKTNQVKCCGNSVCPQVAQALVAANYLPAVHHTLNKEVNAQCR